MLEVHYFWPQLPCLNMLCLMFITAAAYYSDTFINLFMIVPKDIFLLLFSEDPGCSKPIGVLKAWLKLQNIWQA